MLNTNELEKYADVLWWGVTTARTQPFQPGEMVLIRFDPGALPLAEVMYARLMGHGLNVVQRQNSTSTMERAFFECADDRQLIFIPPGDEALYENLNGLISLRAPQSLTHLAHVDPVRIGRNLLARKFLRDIMDKREQAGQFAWTLCACPSDAPAQAAGMTLEEQTRQIIRACFLDTADPVAEWRQVFERAGRIKEWLNRMPVTHYHIRSERTDLEIPRGRHRKWIGISGHNIPSFELFLSPDWRGVEGVYYADQPSYRSGNRVTGARLTFREGRVIEARAEEGETFLQKQLALDPGASALGEFSLTDRRFSRIDRFMADTLFDENFGGEHGNCHVALGAAYADTYDGDDSELSEEMKRQLGFNDSALHWDLVNTEPKTVTARLTDGSSVDIYRDGQFTID